MRQRSVKLAGWGKAAGGEKITFGDQVRYRLTKGETLLDLTDRAIKDALDEAGMEMEDIELIVCGMATPLQAIPCNAALIHERWAKGLDIPAIDINTTCTSFVTGLDIVSSLIELGNYKNAILISGDTASAALNKEQKESYELFSDAAAVFIVCTCSNNEKSGVIYSSQKTWSEGAHDTEIRGGGALLPAFAMNSDNRSDYYFDMKGSKILKLSAKKLPDFIDTCLTEAGMSRDEVSMVVPHQASKALNLIMSRLGFPKGTYADYVSQFGNMISASIPYTMCKVIQEGQIRRGDIVMLVGTAAGLTANLLLLRF